MSLRRTYQRDMRIAAGRIAYLEIPRGTAFKDAIPLIQAALLDRFNETRSVAWIYTAISEYKKSQECLTDGVHPRSSNPQSAPDPLFD
jgi:hypothetical protein